jgi:hypothetical protein
MNRTYCSESACIYENEAITDFTFIIEAIEACTTNRTITLLLPCRVRRYLEGDFTGKVWCLDNMKEIIAMFLFKLKKF